MHVMLNSLFSCCMDSDAEMMLLLDSETLPHCHKHLSPQKRSCMKDAWDCG
jgi:hypothetical protein